jgi:hypothetical protein
VFLLRGSVGKSRVMLTLLMLPQRYQQPFNKSQGGPMAYLSRLKPPGCGSRAERNRAELGQSCGSKELCGAVHPGCKRQRQLDNFRYCYQGQSQHQKPGKRKEILV